jgi:hypothetical protein
MGASRSAEMGHNLSRLMARGGNEDLNFSHGPAYESIANRMQSRAAVRHRRRKRPSNAATDPLQTLP